MSYTIYDIAKKANVSIATVSRVFNHSDSVSEQTRKKVLEVAEAVGYQPQGFARGLASRKKNIIMAVVPVMANYFFMQVLAGIQDTIASTEYELHIYNVHPDRERILQVKRLLNRRWAGGYIFISVHLRDEEWEQIRSDEIPMVLVDDGHPDFDYFRVDNFKGAATATQYFIESGCRRIAMITAGTASIPAVERLDGYRQTLTDAGISHDKRLIVTGDTMYRDGFNEQNGYEAMKKLLSVRPAPEAVVCASDIQAIGALAAMNEGNRKIPIMGYDDIELSRYLGISTMRQPMMEMGITAVQTILNKLDGGNKESVQKMYIPDLILRDTTEPDRSG